MSDSDVGDVVQVSIRVAARPATVFRFLTEPEAFRRWMGEGAEIESSEGGSVRVPYPGGQTASGRVEEVVPDRKVVWSWGFEGGEHGMEPGSTRIEVALEEDEGHTVVTLRHSGIPTEEMRRGTRTGWRHYVSVLADQAARDELDDRLEPLVRSFEAALNEPDDALRDEHLEACFEEDGTFRDASGSAANRAELSAFIGGTHAFQTGVRFELGDDIAQSHDWIRFGWRWLGPEGEVFASGEDLARVSPDGRFSEVVGFWDRGDA